MKRATELPCPCGQGSYATCCQPLHQGKTADTPEQLIRSRYSAFVLLNEPYLLDTWATHTRPERIEFVDGLRWLGLRVVSSRMDIEVDGQRGGMVEFIARYRIGGGSAARQHERSCFVFDGRWRYLDGVSVV